MGEYLGGFCKMCSIIHNDDVGILVLSTIKIVGDYAPIANPKIRWIEKHYVKDMSHTLKKPEQIEFYMTPEQKARLGDRLRYTSKEEREYQDFLKEIEEVET